MKKILKSLRNIFRRQINAFKNIDRPEPIFTKVNIPGLKVHIGTGEINLQGWVNVDARNFDHVHIVSNNMQLEQFSDNSIDELYLCHVLEHISFNEVNAFLKLVYLKLKIGGIIRISVPSFESILKIYINTDKNFDVIKFALMGGQDYEYNFHKSMFDFQFLYKLLINSNYNNISEWDTKSDFGQSLGDWSDVNFKTNNGSVPISLNIKAYKR